MSNPIFRHPKFWTEALNFLPLPAFGLYALKFAETAGAEAAVIRVFIVYGLFLTYPTKKLVFPETPAASAGLPYCTRPTCSSASGSLIGAAPTGGSSPCCTWSSPQPAIGPPGSPWTGPQRMNKTNHKPDKKAGCTHAVKAFCAARLCVICFSSCHQARAAVMRPWNRPPGRCSPGTGR